MSTPVGRVAGPGKFSQRTDQPKVQIPNADYGEQSAYQQQQAGAPMAASPGIPSTGGQAVNLQQILGSMGQRTVPINAPTQRPNEPVTTPAPAGLPQAQQDMQSMAAYLPYFEYAANLSGASWGFQNLVRQIKGAM